MTICSARPAKLLAAKVGALTLFVLDAPNFYMREGGPYAAADGKDFGDNALRFAALAKVGALIGQGLVPAFVPQVVHAHDWQAGLTAAYLHYSEGPRPGSVITVHNLAFQGQFPAGDFWRSSACRPRLSPSRASNITAASVS